MINKGMSERVSRIYIWEDMWNAVHITSQVTHGSNYMLANNRTESDRVVRKNEGGQIKEVIYTQLRDHVKQLFKESQKMLNKRNTLSSFDQIKGSYQTTEGKCQNAM